MERRNCVFPTGGTNNSKQKSPRSATSANLHFVKPQSSTNFLLRMKMSLELRTKVGLSSSCRAVRLGKSFRLLNLVESGIMFPCRAVKLDESFRLSYRQSCPSLGRAVKLDKSFRLSDSKIVSSCELTPNVQLPSSNLLSSCRTYTVRVVEFELRPTLSSRIKIATPILGGKLRIVFPSGGRINVTGMQHVPLWESSGQAQPSCCRHVELNVVFPSGRLVNFAQLKNEPVLGRQAAESNMSQSWQSLPNRNSTPSRAVRLQLLSNCRVIELESRWMSSFQARN